MRSFISFETGAGMAIHLVSPAKQESPTRTPGALPILKEKIGPSMERKSSPRRMDCAVVSASNNWTVGSRISFMISDTSIKVLSAHDGKSGAHEPSSLMLPAFKECPRPRCRCRCCNHRYLGTSCRLRDFEHRCIRTLWLRCRQEGPPCKPASCSRRVRASCMSRYYSHRWQRTQR